MQCRGDHILVGDLMRSMSLLLYKPEEGALELRASVGGLPLWMCVRIRACVHVRTSASAFARPCA